MRRITTIVDAAALLAPLADAPAAADRLPVSSRDDETATLANRISAVADVIATMDARLQRIEPTLPPRPIVSPSPIYPALVSVQDAAVALLASAGGIACGNPRPPDVTGEIDAAGAVWAARGRDLEPHRHPARQRRPCVAEPGLPDGLAPPFRKVETTRPIVVSSRRCIARSRATESR